MLRNRHFTQTRLPADFKDGTAITFVFCVHFIVFAVYYSTDQDLNAVVDEEV